MNAKIIAKTHEKEDGRQIVQSVNDENKIIILVFFFALLFLFGIALCCLSFLQSIVGVLHNLYIFRGLFTCFAFSSSPLFQLL